MPDPKDKPRTLLVGWISRLHLALELGLSVDTLRRWEAQRFGPPCVRAGRKVYYRRAAVEEWLEEQEQWSRGICRAAWSLAMDHRGEIRIRPP